MFKKGCAVLILVSVVGLAGCGSADKKRDSQAPAAKPAAEQSTEKPADSAALDIKSDKTPEGVTDRFFAAFFSGQDQEAQNLLTSKAQEMTKENFSAQASDTVAWKITKKETAGQTAYVFVEVSDLNESGERSSEELIFALRQEESRWGIAGFNAGKLAVNFEETAVETLAAESEISDPAAAATLSAEPQTFAPEPEKVGQIPGQEIPQ